MTDLKRIPIREEFSDPQGRFENFDTYDQAQRIQLAKQSHVNVRTFIPDNMGAPINMLFLDGLTQTQLESMNQTALEGKTVIKPGEQWTGAVTVGKQPDRNNWRGLNMTCSGGLNTTASVAPSSDLSTGFDDGDFISIALPDFPLSAIDLSQSYVKFSSIANGSFDGSPNTASIPFTANVNTWNTGNTELRFPRSLLFSGLVGAARTTALGAVTAVRFDVFAKGACQFRCLAFRLVSKDWQYPAMDMDTRYQRMENPPPPDGSYGGTVFPSSVVNGLTTNFPILYWADDPPGKADPRPVNAKVTTSFNTGSLTAASGITNYAAQFNLPGAALIGDMSGLRFSNAMTLEAWIKPDNLTKTRAIVTKWQDTAGKRGYRLAVTTAGELQLQYSVDGSATTTVTSSGAGISTSAWQHVAATFQVVGSGGASLPLLITSSTANTATVNFYKNGVGIGGQSGLPGPSIFNTTLTNLALNPSFEFDVSNWIVGQGGTGGSLVRSTARSFVGGASGVLTKGTNFTYAEITVIPVVSGQAQRWAVWVYPSATGPINLVARPNLGPGFLIQSFGGVPANQWSRLSTTFTPTGGATSATFDVGWENADAIAGTTINIDAALNVQTPTDPDYFDGDTPNCVWTGATGASTSIQQVPFKIGAWNTG